MLSKNLSELKGKLERAESDATERGAVLQAAREHVAERQGRATQAQTGIAEIEQQAVAAGQAAAASKAAIERAEAEIAGGREDVELARAAHEAAETTLTGQRRALQQAERAAQDALFGERECASKIVEIDNSVKVIDQQITRGDAEVAKLTEELAADPIPAVREALDAAVEVRLFSEKSMAEARTRLQVDARVAPLRDRLGELRLKEQAAKLNAEQFASQLREANADETLLATAAEGAPRPSTLQGEITRLTQAIGELGAVNLAALEELSTSRERKGYLDSQAADLEEAVHTLEDAIRRIDRETRELLRGTFESVNRHFGALFPTLFGGGEAKLIMTGEEILDAGVQVMAQPPGKRNTSIHLLSGGEKALTAISLVFSLFQLNPAPFCLLDEVDAPLDDTNTQRFCELVKRMSAQTQFLFISHNKISMEMAEQLIGVTMPESGVSRVVAVDIEEALRIREELAA